jgi:hypothetical protein
MLSAPSRPIQHFSLLLLLPSRPLPLLAHSFSFSLPLISSPPSLTFLSSPSLPSLSPPSPYLSFRPILSLPLFPPSVLPYSSFIALFLLPHPSPPSPLPLFLPSSYPLLTLPSLPLSSLPLHSPASLGHCLYLSVAGIFPTT